MRMIPRPMDRTIPALAGAHPVRPSLPPGPRSLDASVIIVCSRPACLRRCLESLRSALEPRPLEVLAVVNGGEEGCEEVLGEFRLAMPELKALQGDGGPPGGARNKALAEARGRWLCFLDDDAAVPEGYFAALEAAAQRHPLAAAIGGPELTPPGSPVMERCIGHTLGSPFAAGRFHRRAAGYETDTWTDDRGLILCNLAFDRRALEQEGLSFDDKLVRNEENLLLQRLFRRGRRAVHSPAFFVYHRRRSSVYGFCRQCFLSGKGRAEMTFKLPGALSAYCLLPLLPAACVAGALFAPRLLLPPAAAYLAATALHALYLRRLHKEKAAAAILWLTFLMPAAQLSYAAGLLAGALHGSVSRLRRLWRAY